MLLPDPVGATQRMSRRASIAATTSACPGRKASRPKTSRSTCSALAITQGSLTESGIPDQALYDIVGPAGICGLSSNYTSSVDMKLELVAVPVTDVDRAKSFYVEQVGFHADHDQQVNDQLRFVQLTPPGSACSIVMGTGITEMAPGSQKGLQMVIEAAEALKNELRGRGVETSDVQVMDWGSFVFFSDPDGNTWSLQQLPEVRNPPRP